MTNDEFNRLVREFGEPLARPIRESGGGPLDSFEDVMAFAPQQMRRFAELVAEQCANEAGCILRGEADMSFVAQQSGVFTAQELVAQAVEAAIRERFKGPT